jgi:hypothetical protein
LKTSWSTEEIKKIKAELIQPISKLVRVHSMDELSSFGCLALFYGLGNFDHIFLSATSPKPQKPHVGA